MEHLKAKLASQEAELTFKNQNIEALITKIGLQTEKVSSKKEAADVEAQKVRYRLLYLAMHSSYHTVTQNLLPFIWTGFCHPGRSFSKTEGL